ncbi:capsular polysaccharide export protein [Paraburkholderia caballeronis]|nr:capsular polysaccharide export protein [Paraburkholderia caballeronis]TDV14193.1 capsular polysaccharide export protein [Paraburkholderia caballeronis]TDV23358.1 capsular polysaccharide export protein [Paraburkholderia caballeronis]
MHTPGHPDTERHVRTRAGRRMVRGRRTIAVLTGFRSRAFWGHRALGRIAHAIARWSGRPADLLYAGPVWSHCAVGEPLLSWIQLQAKGPYHAAMSDALQSLLKQDATLGTTPEISSLMRRVVASGAGRNRTNYRPAFDDSVRLSTNRKILLIDERRLPLADDRASFARMLASARDMHPNADILLWQTTDERCGTWQLGSLDDLPETTCIVDRHANFFAVLNAVDAVYTVEAPEGLEAIIAGVRPHVFGRPYYAGLGHTYDQHRPVQSLSRPTIEALFDAVYLKLARYIDPDTGGPATFERVLECIELQRSMHNRFRDLQIVEAHGFQIWKRRFAAPFLGIGGGRLYWHRHAQASRADSTVALWGARSADHVRAGTRIVRIEDGFFHSLGLGSDMSAPLSQVIDRNGIYFDAQKPSDLTHILNEGTFDSTEVARAEKLRRLIVESGVTKYNLGRKAPQWQAPAGSTVILVVGQVADDASIRLGAGDFRTAEQVLQHARANNPDAFIVYKPHPDVLSGNRTGLVDARRYANVVDAEADLLSLLEHTDEVHTISSLAGFEGLLRQKKVHAYGYPFYAGWGLTHDEMKSVPWRQRSLKLDELVAGALIRYPIYWNWQARLFSTPEAVVRTLAVNAARPMGNVSADPSRPWRKAVRWVKNLAWYVLWEIRRGIE